jgi:DNA-binding MurR/RpiR family transcriptional regulator
MANLVELVDRRYQGLSPAHRRLAEFILGSYQEAALLTSAELGRRVGVDESTVVRFAQQLGYPGFPELRAALGDLLRERTVADRMERALGKLRTIRDPLERVLDQDVRALLDLRRTWSPRVIESVAAQLRRARTVYVMGLGVSRALASFVEFRLRRMGMDVRAVTYGGSEAWERLFGIGRKDVLLAFGFFRGYRDTILALRHARTRGARTIVVTDTPSSPLAAEADVVLVGRRGDLTVINSLVVPMALVNILTIAVALQHASGAVAALQAWDALRQQFEGPRPAVGDGPPRRGRGRTGNAKTKARPNSILMGGGSE